MADMFMYSINPVYDYTSSGFGEAGNSDERMQLYRLAEKEGVGITVMKPLSGGRLLDASLSPLGIALTPVQCIQYCLDKPGVLCCLPGVCSKEETEDILRYFSAAEEEKDYSRLGSAVPDGKNGRCVYCGHCLPCPQGIDIGLVNKYYDLARMGDEMAAGHYRNLAVNAEDCISCGHCDEACPFGVGQAERMQEIRDWFRTGSAGT